MQPLPYATALPWWPMCPSSLHLCSATLSDDMSRAVPTPGPTPAPSPPPSIQGGAAFPDTGDRGPREEAFCGKTGAAPTPRSAPNPALVSLSRPLSCGPQLARCSEACPGAAPPGPGGAGVETLGTTPLLTWSLMAEFCLETKENGLQQPE